MHERTLLTKTDIIYHAIALYEFIGTLLRPGCVSARYGSVVVTPKLRASQWLPR
jgi:hypothetical protein